jgi:hypothetical protein
MPESLQFEDMPRALVEKQIEPFREGYIRGSKLLSREWSPNGYDVFFQIPTPIARIMDDHELQGLKAQLRGWWRDRTNQSNLSRSSIAQTGSI